MRSIKTDCKRVRSVNPEVEKIFYVSQTLAGAGIVFLAAPSGTEVPLCWFEGHIHDFPSSDVDIGYLLNLVVMLHFTMMFFMIILVAVLSVHLLVMAIFYGRNFGLYWALYATERQIASKSRLHTQNKFKRYLLYICLNVWYIEDMFLVRKLL